MQGHAERLEQRRRRVAQLVGDPVREAFGPRHQAAQRAVDGVAGEVGEEAKVLVAGEAALAGAAGDRRVEADAFARPRAGSHDARDLVAEDERPGEACVADPALFEPV